MWWKCVRVGGGVDVPGVWTFLGSCSPSLPSVSLSPASLSNTTYATLKHHSIQINLFVLHRFVHGQGGIWRCVHHAFMEMQRQSGV